MSTMASEPEATTAKQVDQTETPLESLASICTVLAIGLFVMTFIFQNYEIPSGSMEKTLLIGDHVLVDRTSFSSPTKRPSFVHCRDIQRGDVIVFYKPNPETPDLHLVKRVIGIPGDRIHLHDGVVYLNGVAQDEPEAGKPSADGDPYHAYNPYRDDFPSVPPPPDEIHPLGISASWALDLPNHIQNGDLVVPPGMVFAMGDNRTESLDGRYWGFVPRQNIVGSPLFVYWSFETLADQMNKTSLGDRLGFMGHILVHFFDETRWRRTFHIVR